MSLRHILDQLSLVLERATSVPLSGSCVVNRAELTSLIEQARMAVPVEVADAVELLAERDAVLRAAERDARLHLAEARRRSAELLDNSTILAGARLRGEETVAAARAEAARMLKGADEYCDRRLAAFEGDLGRALTEVRRGRDRLHARMADESGELSLLAESVIDLTAGDAETPAPADAGVAGLGTSPDLQ